MTVRICDRCGDVTFTDDPCRCATPCDPVDVRRRHREAVRRAQRTDLLRARERDVQRAA